VLAVAAAAREHGAREHRDGHAGARSDRAGGRMTPIGRKGSRSSVGRKILSSLFVAFCAFSVLIALIPLGFILSFVVTQGIRSVNLDFFTQMPKPVGQPGRGMPNAIVGTRMVRRLAALVAVRTGVVSRP